MHDVLAEPMTTAALRLRGSARHSIGEVERPAAVLHTCDLMRRYAWSCVAAVISQSACTTFNTVRGFISTRYTVSFDPARLAIEADIVNAGGCWSARRSVAGSCTAR